MKSSRSNTVEISWDSSLTSLFQGKKPSPLIQKIVSSGIEKIYDLLWILPLRIHKTPIASPFRDAQLNEYFRGEGKIIHVEIKPAYGRKGRGNILLYNGFIVVQDLHSAQTMILRWFNLYPNQKKQLEQLEMVHFLGVIQEFKSQKQIINPQILNQDTISPYIIEYPTINKVSGTHIHRLIKLIPRTFWFSVPQILPQLENKSSLDLGTALSIIHGQYPPEKFNPIIKKEAEERIIYEEFLVDQLKIQTRRKFIKRKITLPIQINKSQLSEYTAQLPFKLTPDQDKVFNEVLEDLKMGHPMMRIVQGDVGCGKTIVAFLTAMVMQSNKKQVALMCPTEALAQQHFQTFQELNSQMKIELLLGSTKTADKKNILKRLKNGETEVVIGTHSLFQDSVQFHNLGLAIIDEQHKFGVEQRLRLVAKGEAAHCLIMTATPIPRTLSLAQYGDLDISTIKTMPIGRKGIKTRITEIVNYSKYIEFIKQRLSQSEQAYFVFPAIDESEINEIQNVKESLLKYRKIFHEYRIEMLHGQMKSDEKESVIKDFQAKKINILISTSVIEVGINVPNATVMSIYNPERFGLSSLHQLRGRVGRGDKPGFCFLVLDKDPSPEVMQRLKVIENNLDGFVIAEEDLRFRGEGDLFGVEQSGSVSSRRLANFLIHTSILEQAIQDIEKLKKTRPGLLEPIFEKLAKDQKIIDTI